VDSETNGAGLVNLQPFTKLLGLKAGEGHRTLILFLQNFCVVAITIAGKSARDTFFLSRFNKSYLPLMFVVCAAAVGLSSSLYGRLSGHMSRSAMFNMLCLIFTVGVLLVGLHVAGWAIPFLYVWIEIVVATTTLQLWLLASDTFDPRQAKRLFGIIGGGGSLAAALVGTGLKPFVHAFGPNTLLILIAAAIALYWVLGRFALRNVLPPAPRQAVRRRTTQTKKLDPYLTAIAVVIGLSAVVSAIIDYQFKIIAAQSLPDERNLAGFFGNFYAATGVASLLVQFFLTSAILSRFGLLAGLLALPLSLNLGSAAILLNPRLWSGAFAKFSDQTFKFTLNNSSMELLWLPVRPEKRKAVRPVIGGTIKSICEVCAGLVMFVLVKMFAPRYLSLVALGALVIWIAVTFRLKSLYVKTLISAIEKRQIDFEGLNLDAQDPAMIAVIEKALRSDDEMNRFSALELLGGLPLKPWQPTLRELFASGSPEVRKRIISLAADDEAVLPDEPVLAAMSEGPEIAVEAMRLSGLRRMKRALPRLSGALDDPDPRVRAAAAAAVIEIGEGPVERAHHVLGSMFASSDPGVRVAALQNLGSNASLISREQLLTALSDPERRVREAALKLIAQRHEDSLVSPVVDSLGDVRLAPVARRALTEFPPDRVVGELANALKTDEASSSKAVGAVRALGDIETPETVDVLLHSLQQWGLGLASPVAASLRRIASRSPLPSGAYEQTAAVTLSLIRYAYICNRTLHLLPEGEGEFLVREHLENEMREAIAAVLRLFGLGLPPGAAEEIIMIVRERDSARMPYVFELLENMLDRERRELLSGLLDSTTVEQRDSVGVKHYKDLPDELQSELEAGLRSRRGWVSAVYTDYLKRSGNTGVLDNVDWTQLPESELLKEVLSPDKSRNTMYSTLEKTILLKSVNLFRDIPAEKLSQIAQITEETHWPAGAVVLKEGDPGDSLFIVAEGKVRIHKGDLDLAMFKKGDCLGEMAVLDHSPRSADATVVEDATLLKITQDDFYEVLSANPEITQGIIRLLTRRLRESNLRLTAKS